MGEMTVRWMQGVTHDGTNSEEPFTAAGSDVDVDGARIVGEGM